MFELSIILMRKEKSRVFTYSDEWLNGLYNEYQEKRIPHGELQQSKRQIVL
ncbi:hypothetical protein BRLA_c024640 [Brevibacillus laterosporus LMG 15441]|uniref:Uncharacterized protein n=1 Tax=Brevibacillus laterosporus LMG 15441 TaxID=1042163 RepID=A0A075R4P6_BRELA|nr:hypothetical protein BRLA_c024640 [Brevibacillus laterosporus LMG 15441]